MDVIGQATSGCERSDCSLTMSGGTVTCMGWTATYDKNGNRTDHGDPNIHSQSLRCHSCKKEWSVRTQYGNTEIKLESPPTSEVFSDQSYSIHPA